MYQDWMITILLLALILTVCRAQTPPSEPSVEQLAQAVRDIDKEEHIVEPCDPKNSNNSFIYCYGRILEAVNVHGLYKDSKEFVDMPMKKSPNDTLNDFIQEFGSQALESINSTKLKQFIDEHFAAAGTELESCQLTDWQEQPPKLMQIKDPKFRQWALELNLIWKKLCRRVKNTSEPNQHSLIYVPNNFIVPGGRFREFYYWDAYWIIKGLAACGLTNEIKNMILNFVSCVKRFGFVPNGGRVYYLERSQPPMLIPMAYVYYETTQDLKFIEQILPDLVDEYLFWVNNRNLTVTGTDDKIYTVYQYRAGSTTPRPESFRVDLINALSVPVEKRQKFYQDVASAAESGWDFSSRWFHDKWHISTIETTDIAPVDLNAFICYNLGILSYFYRLLENEKKAQMYTNRRLVLRSAMAHVFYNQTMGSWFDYFFKSKTQNLLFYASTAVPLFAECYLPLNLPTPENAVDYMNVSHILSYRGGIPTSMLPTGQQWDFPNGWSPLQHMVVEGLRTSQDPYAQEMAFQIAEKWLRDNYDVYIATGHMWEKYDITGAVPAPGSGGEYDVQAGFGWTNGAALDLLVTYYDRLTASDTESPTKKPGAASSIAQNLALVILMWISTLQNWI